MKTLTKLTALLSLLLLSGLLSCGKDNPLITPIEFTIDNFPHEIGTVWQYQKDDRINMTTDTIFVRIDDTTRITDDSLLVYVVITDFVTALAGPYDTSYWYFSDDTLSYYKFETDTFIIKRKLVFPIEDGSAWSSEVFPTDSNEVIENKAVTILGRTYQNAFHILRTAGGFNEYYTDNYWYVPNIGLIQSNENHILWTTTKDETWSLISFHKPDSLELSDFPIQINASWTYNVINNLVDCISCYDTCVVTILDSVYNGFGSIAEKWIFEYPNQERVVSNTLNQNKLFLKWHNFQIFFSLEFPLTVGKRWLDDYGLEESYMKIAGIKTITTEAGTFKDTYYLKGQTGGFEKWADFEVWIAKGFGIVKLQFTSATNYTSETWELNSYNPNKPIEPFTIDKFPSYNNMSWTYQVFDNISQTVDTLLVQVAESSTVAIWNYTRTDSSWQEIVSLEGTVAKFFYPDNMIEPFKSYQFPIEIGNSWTTYPLGNSSEVVSLTPIITPAGRFFPCYAIETVYRNNSLITQRETDWVTPLVGSIQKTIINDELGINEHWRLIDYSNR